MFRTNCTTITIFPCASPPPSRIFVALSDSGNDPQGTSNASKNSLFTARFSAPGDNYEAEVNTDKFASAALSDPEVVRFLAMHTTSACRGEAGDLTLREALRGLGRGSKRAGAGGVGGRSEVAGETSTVRWGDVEGLLFDPYDPSEIMADPPSTVSVSLPTSAEGTQEEEVGL